MAGSREKFVYSCFSSQVEDVNRLVVLQRQVSRVADFFTHYAKESSTCINIFILKKLLLNNLITISFRLPNRKRIQDFLSTKFNVANDDIIKDDNRDDNQDGFCKLK